MKKSKVLSVVLTLALAIGTIGSYSASAAAAKKPAVKPAAPTTVEVWQGSGQYSTFRVGPGKDAEGVQVYSITTMTADVLFDKDGRILNVWYDALEISTPNYDGESMPHFSGWPGKEGYNISSHAKEGEEAKVTGVSQNTNESAAAEVNAWQTKRERGDRYGMNPKNDWHRQANFYQNFFRGKTIAEIEAWVARNTSDLNGRPLKADSTKEEDKAKYAKLTAAEKAVLADVVSGATMSLKDSHGDFIAVLKDAYSKRHLVSIPVK